MKMVKNLALPRRRKIRLRDRTEVDASQIVKRMVSRPRLIERQTHLLRELRPTSMVRRRLSDPRRLVVVATVEMPKLPKMAWKVKRLKVEPEATDVARISHNLP